MFIFPGVGLGALAARAQHVTDAMVVAAARALSACSPARLDPSAPIYPPVEAVRDVAHRVALAVGMAAVAAGDADPLPPDDLERRIVDSMWTPRYAPIRYRAE
jgi:malate dehydrogenase (oxaloacetate-decarboxylating)